MGGADPTALSWWYHATANRSAVSRIGSVVPAIARPCTTVASSGVAMIAAPGNAVFDSPTRNAATAPTANPVIVNTAGTVDRSHGVSAFSTTPKLHEIAVTVTRMAAYFIVNARITDPEGLARYRAAVGPSFEGRRRQGPRLDGRRDDDRGHAGGERAVVLESPTGPLPSTGTTPTSIRRSSACGWPRPKASRSLSMGADAPCRWALTAGVEGADVPAQIARARIAAS